MNSKGKIPFGLLFEEVFQGSGENRAPIYDEKRDISVIKDSNGNLVPFVDAAGPNDTETATKVAKESTDYSIESSLNIQSTVTVTHTKREETDSDVNRFATPNTFLSLKPSDETGDLPRKIYPSKMRVERLKKEQLSHEATQTRTNRATLAQS